MQMQMLLSHNITSRLVCCGHGQGCLHWVALNANAGGCPLLWAALSPAPEGANWLRHRMHLDAIVHSMVNAMVKAG